MKSLSTEGLSSLWLVVWFDPVVGCRDFAEECVC
jgi:hypothetical protein